MVFQNDFSEIKPKITYYEITKIIPIINLEKNFCINYHCKALPTQVMIWKNSVRSASVS